MARTMVIASDVIIKTQKTHLEAKNERRTVRIMRLCGKSGLNPLNHGRMTHEFESS